MNLPKATQIGGDRARIWNLVREAVCLEVMASTLRRPRAMQGSLLSTCCVPLPASSLETPSPSSAKLASPGPGVLSSRRGSS